MIAEAELLLVFLLRVKRHYKVASSALIDVVDKPTPRIPLCRYCKEKRMRNVGHVATIGEENFNLKSLIVDTSIRASKYFSYF